MDLPWYEIYSGVPKRSRAFKNQPSDLLIKYGKVNYILGEA